MFFLLDLLIRWKYYDEITKELATFIFIKFFMGNCTTLSKKIKITKDRERKFIIGEKSTNSSKNSKKNENIYLQSLGGSPFLKNWNSNQLDLIDEKIEQLCVDQTKKHLNFNMFLDFFPNLKKSFPLTTLKRYFKLFDHTDNGYINTKQIISGLSIIYFTQKTRFGEILMWIYKFDEPNKIISPNQMKNFMRENQKFYDSYQSEKLNPNSLTAEGFCKLISQKYNIKKYKRLFDCFNANLEERFVRKMMEYSNEEIWKNTEQDDQDEDKHKEEEFHMATINDIKAGIRIKNNDQVFLIEKSWFISWINFILSYECQEVIFQIQGEPRISYSSDLIGVEKAKFIRPTKIDNKILFGEYEGELKPPEQLAMHVDYVIVPKYIWDNLKKIYRGGPEISRRYPNMYPNIIFQVSVSKKGVFQEDSVKRIICYQDQNIKERLNDYSQNKFMFINLRNQKRWKTITPEGLHQITPKIHLAFICLVEPNCCQEFKKRYLKKQDKIIDDVHYGESFQIHKDGKKVTLRVINILKSEIKTQYQQKGYEYQRYFNREDMRKKFLDEEYPLKPRNKISGMKSQGKNDSYFISVIQCLIVTPYFQEYFLKKIYKKEIKSNRDLPLSLELSTIIKKHVENQTATTIDIEPIKRTLFQRILQSQQKGKASQQEQHHHPSIILKKLLQQLCKELKPEKQSNQLSQSSKKTKRVVTETKTDFHKKILNNFIVFIDEKKKKKSQPIIQKDSNYNGDDDDKKRQNPQQQKQKQQQIPQQVQQDEQIQRQQQEQQVKEQSKSIIENFFGSTINIKRSCQVCDENNFQLVSRYVVNMPVPEDNEAFYEAVFYPAQNKVFGLDFLQKYAITIKRSEKFLTYVERFSQVIGKPLDRLRFCEVNKYEFRKQYTQTDYNSSLQFLNLKPTDTIYIYEIADYELENVINIPNTKVNLNQKKDMIVDFSSFMEWNVGKVKRFNSTHAEIYNFSGISRVEIYKIAHFQMKTRTKPYIQVPVLHRKINIRSKKIQYFLDPFLINISECMTWGTVKKIIETESLRYFNIIESRREVSKTNENKSRKNSMNSAKSEFSIKVVEENKNLFSQVIKGIIDGKGMTDRIVHNFKIRILQSNSGQECYRCKRKSKIDYFDLEEEQKSQMQVETLSQISRQERTTQKLSRKKILKNKNHCYGEEGCQPDLEDPISLELDLKKVFFTIDWNLEFSDFEEHEKIKEHPSYDVIKAAADKQYTKLDDCFASYIQDRYVDDCKLCRDNNKIIERKYMIKSPNILIIELDRLKKINNKFVRSQAKLGEYKEIKLSICLPDNPDDIYYLYAVICLQCQKSTTEEFKWYCYVLRSKNCWIKCDNEYTQRVSFSQIKPEQIFILFYRRRSIESTLVIKVL